MLGDVVPVLDLSVPVARVEVFQRPQLQKIRVRVRDGEFERRAIARYRRVARAFLYEEVIETDEVHQEERAVVVVVIADEPVRDGGLRRDGSQRRMRMNAPGRCVEA